MLPPTILSSTGDAFRASRLERMLSNFTASYKLYFLKAVFDEAEGGADFVPFDLLAARMVASAWYPVLYFRLNLGATDQLTKVVNLAYERCDLGRGAATEEIVSTLLATDDERTQKALRALTRYVPYRLIRVFYEDRFAEEKRSAGSIPDARVNSLISDFNHQNAAGAPYTLEYDGSGIVLDGDWARYFIENRLIVKGWLDMRLVQYLQARNPSVPAIPLKIYPPVQRDLRDARNWWTNAIAARPMREIYTRTAFDEDGFAVLGPLSIDHFVPWSFVLHDEPWNLVPAFRNTNSSKGDKLPTLDEYLDEFCVQQFTALLSLRNQRKHRKVTDAYLAIDPNAREYEDSDRSLEAFADSLCRVIVPLHQIAANQGFPLWEGAGACA